MAENYEAGVKLCQCFPPTCNMSKEGASVKGTAMNSNPEQLLTQFWKKGRKLVRIMSFSGSDLLTEPIREMFPRTWYRPTLADQILQSDKLSTPLNQREAN